MSIPIACPQCQTQLAVPERLEGKKVRCTRCGETFLAAAEPVAVDDSSGVQRAESVPWVQPKSWPTSLPPGRLRYDEADSLRPTRSRSSVGLVAATGAALVAIVAVGSLAAWWFLSDQPPTPSPIRPNGLPIAVDPIQLPRMVPAPGGPRRPGSAPLRYRWQGGPHVYDVRVKAEKDNHFEIHEGHCTVFLNKNAPPRGPAAPVEERKGTGTAFVVHADGYLLTCAHVIADAEKIEVVLGGVTYGAIVLAQDLDNDLALIQIDARGLPTLSLASSDRARVGQKVWAIGFPLAGHLDDTLKANEGGLSGVSLKAGAKGLQTNAAINAGNSGGPLVTENGAVLGVIGGKLVGAGIDKIGFATPINEARPLLKVQGLAPRPEAGGAVKLEGPTLVNHVKPAVAFVRVTLGQRAEAEALKLTCRGRLSQHQEPRPGAIPMPRPPSLGVLAGTDGTIEMKANGDIVKAIGGHPLPYLLGELGQFLIETLPPDNRPTWKTEGKCTIEKGISGLQKLRPGARPGGPKTFRQGQERSESKRGEAAGDTINFQKHYDLKVDAAGADPALDLTWDGSITFDVTKGLPRIVELRGTFTEGERRWPFTVTYQLLEGEARERVLNPPREEPRPLADAELTQTLADLQGPGRRVALDRLALALPTAARREEVAGLLEPLLADPDLFTRQAAVKALAVWGTKDNVPALLKRLDDKNVFVRIPVMAALGRLQDGRAAQPLAQRLVFHEDRKDASKALQALGSPAEKAVIPLLQHADWFVRLEACKILKAIGTQESKAGLLTAARDPNTQVAAAAKEAAAAVDDRP